MIKELHIQNYKAFENLKLEGFSQINLIGGLNNTGKTTLLEAIFNVYDRLSIDILLKQSVWRSGIPLTNLTQEIWSPAFHNFDISKNISFNYLTDKNIREELLISVDNTFIPENRTTVFDIINSASDNRDSGIKNALKIVLNTGDTVLQQTYHYLTGDKLNTLNKKLPAKNPEIAKYVSTKNINTSMEAVLYGDIIKENLEKEVIKALQIIEPRLKMIIPVPIAENMTILYGDIGLKSKIPLYNLGDGLSRVLAFLNSIVKCKNGTVLIDELENGIHYTVHPKLWEIFLEFARKFNVQIFATTHSSELASAFNEIAMEDRGAHFSYIELIRNIKDNRIAGNVIDADTLLYKLKAGKPYRGE